MTKKIASIMTAAVLVLGLSACGGAYETEEDSGGSAPGSSNETRAPSTDVNKDGLYVTTAQRPGGGTVECAMIYTFQGVTLDCNWAEATRVSTEST